MADQKIVINVSASGDGDTTQTHTQQQNVKSLFEKGKTYTFKNLFDNHALDLPGSNTAENTKIRMYTSNNSNAQKWIAEIDSHHPEKGMKLVTSAHSDMQKVFTMIPEYQNNRCVLQTFTGQPGQYWHLIESDDGTHRIYNSHFNVNVSNMGQDESVRGIIPDDNDLHQHWKATAS